MSLTLRETAEEKSEDDSKSVTTFDGLKSWEQTELPWIIFWLKELITWGVLDPVAAALMAAGIVITRDEAIDLASDYYEGLTSDISANEQLNAQTIQKWVDSQKTKKRKARRRQKREYRVKLERRFDSKLSKSWTVIPILKKDRLEWLDPAGYLFASSTIPKNWSSQDWDRYDYTLHPIEKRVRTRLYFK